MIIIKYLRLVSTQGASHSATHPVPTQFVGQQSTGKLRENVTVEEGGEDDSLLSGRPGKVLCLYRGSIVQGDRPDFSHGHNRHTQVDSQCVDVEEAEEGHKDHDVSGLREWAVALGFGRC